MKEFWDYLGLSCVYMLETTWLIFENDVTILYWIKDEGCGDIPPNWILCKLAAYYALYNVLRVKWSQSYSEGPYNNLYSMWL